MSTIDSVSISVPMPPLASPLARVDMLTHVYDSVASVFVSNGVASQDSIPPEVTLVSPAEGETTADTPLVFDVTDETALASVTVLVQFSHSLGTLCAYRRGAFLPPFDALSSTSTPVAGTTRFSLRHNDGWPAANTVTVLVDPVDTGGNLDA